MADEYSKAKTTVAQWLDRIGTDAIDRRVVLAGLDAVKAELPFRDDWRDVRAVLLSGTSSIEVSLSSDGVAATAIGPGIVVATVAPGWGSGWRSTLKTEPAYAVLSWFLHYAGQYVHRSQMLKVILPLALDGQVVTHPFGISASTTRYGPYLSFPGSRSALADALSQAHTWADLDDDCESPDKLMSVNLLGLWTASNTMDPHVHQAAFQLLRGMELAGDGYSAEALLAYDCVLEVAKAFLVSRRIVDGTATRAQCLEALRMDKETQELAAWAGFLRNHFSAHSGGWRCWDFEEVIGDDLENVQDMAAAALREMVALEPSNRLIDPAPESWADWFWCHFELLWKSIWFDALTTFEGVE